MALHFELYGGIFKDDADNADGADDGEEDTYPFLEHISIFASDGLSEEEEEEEASALKGALQLSIGELKAETGMLKLLFEAHLNPNPNPNPITLNIITGTRGT